MPKRITKTKRRLIKHMVVVKTAAAVGDCFRGFLDPAGIGLMESLEALSFVNDFIVEGKLAEPKRSES